MKITLAFTSEEREEATAVLVALRRLHPGAKVHKSGRHPPFEHIYLTTKKPETPCNSSEND